MPGSLTGGEGSGGMCALARPGWLSAAEDEATSLKSQGLDVEEELLFREKLVWFAESRKWILGRPNTPTPQASHHGPSLWLRTVARGYHCHYLCFVDNSCK